MFYCDYCRVAWEYPKSLGWPSMGVSQGQCELCLEVRACHDVHHSQLERYKNSRQMKLMQCGECDERRWSWKDDYLCIFCRGDAELPNPEKELAEYRQRLDLLDFNENFQEWLDNLR